MQFTLGSRPWFEALESVLRARAAMSAAPDGHFTFSETYSAPPKSVHQGDDPLGWSLTLRESHLEFAATPLVAPTAGYEVDYDLACALACLQMRGDPAERRAALDTMSAARADGRFVVIGDERRIPAWFLDLHDDIAAFTART